MARVTINARAKLYITTTGQRGICTENNVIVVGLNTSRINAAAGDCYITATINNQRIQLTVDCTTNCTIKGHSTAAAGHSQIVESTGLRIYRTGKGYCTVGCRQSCTCTYHNRTSEILSATTGNRVCIDGCTTTNS